MRPVPRRASTFGFPQAVSLMKSGPRVHVRRSSDREMWISPAPEMR
jgi:hypothetical protein